MLTKILLATKDPKLADRIKNDLGPRRYEVYVAKDDRAFNDFLNRDLHRLTILDSTTTLASREIITRVHRSPVLVLTDTLSDASIVNGLEAGADEVMLTTYIPAIFRAKVSALIRKSGMGGTELVMGNLRVDPINRNVWRGEKKVELTGREFSLLEYFMKHPDQLITRKMIANAVWPEQLNPFSNTIDVYVTYLRKKLMNRGEVGPVVLETVRGQGYMLKAA